MNPVTSINLADIIAENRRRWPNTIATVDEDGRVRLTYPELDARVCRLAGALIGAGLGAGDRILWLGQNSFRILELILAAAKLGAILCPANWRQSPDELDFIVADAQAKLVVWQDAEIGERVAGHESFPGVGHLAASRRRRGREQRVRSVPGRRRPRARPAIRRSRVAAAHALHRRVRRYAQWRFDQPWRDHRPKPGLCPGARDYGGLPLSQCRPDVPCRDPDGNAGDLSDGRHKCLRAAQRP